MTDVNRLIDGPFGQGRRHRPDAPAVALERDDEVTYAGLRERRDRHADLLASLGVRPGDRVGMLLGNSVDYVALFFAIARLGAVAVRLNFRLTSAELAFALEDSGCRVLCVGDEHADRVPAGATVAQAAGPGAGWSAVVLRAAPEPGPAPRDDLLMLMYTSGTTGRPKAAMWTHATAYGCAVSQALQWSYTERTVALTTGPLYHAGAFEALMLPALLAGGRAICSRSGGFDIERVVGVMADAGVTDAMLYPFMIYDLLRVPGLDARRLPALRRIVTGGDPIAAWAVEAARERLPEVEIVQSYGLTEATAFACLGGPELDAHPDAVGRPLPLDEIGVVRDDGTTAATGEVGEVVLRGPGVCAGYWRRPEETAATFRSDGWFRTGDLGRVDADGILFLAGRKKDMIRSGGENISPAEVESVLTDHPDILDAAVVAVPDARWLEVGCAVLVVRAGAELDDAEIVAHCRERLAGYKCPKHLVRVDEVPRNASGKVLKAQLRDRYRELGSPVSRSPAR